MSMSNEQRLANVHARAIKNFDADYSAVYYERMQCLKDRRFYSIAGAQWEGPLGEQFENKPRFEMNKIHLAVIRIISEYRNNRITVDFTSRDGSQDDKLADACDGLYRADEQDSGAQEAYDNAFEEAVGGGFGAFRYRAAYENEDDDDDSRQRIRIEPIFDADSSVFFDFGAKRQDKMDAKRCTVLHGMTPEAYEEEYGDSPASWQRPINETYFDWSTPRIVYVAEYYEVEEKKELVRFFRGLALTDDEPNEIEVSDKELKEEPEMLASLLARGFTETRSKRKTVRKIHKYILNGVRVVEDCGYIAGRCIPIVPVYGKRWYVDGVERCMGHVRLATDAQRLKNMLVSALAELSAESPVEKPLLMPEQIVGHQQMWAEDNVKKYPYKLINPVLGPNGEVMLSQPIAYTKAPNIPPALAALLQITEQDLQDLLGNQQAGEEIQSNISGKAVELVQQRLDMQVYIYMSNFAKGIKRGGEIWLSMAKDLYVEEMRRMKTIAADGATTGSVELMRPMVDEETQETVYENDLSAANFDVVAGVGPSSATRRSATVRAVTGLIPLTQDPETQQMLTAVAVMNLEGEGLDDVHAYFRNKLVRMGVVKPTEEEQQQLANEQQNQQPDPNAIYLQAAAKKAMADAKKAGADAALSVAKIGQTEADTLKTLAEVDSTERQDALAAAQLLVSMQTSQQPPAPPEGQV